MQDGVSGDSATKDVVYFDSDDRVLGPLLQKTRKFPGDPKEAMKQLLCMEDLHRNPGGLEACLLATIVQSMSIWREGLWNPNGRNSRKYIFSGEGITPEPGYEYLGSVSFCTGACSGPCLDSPEQGHLRPRAFQIHALGVKVALCDYGLFLPLSCICDVHFCFDKRRSKKLEKCENSIEIQLARNARVKKQALAFPNSDRKNFPELS